MEPLSNYSFNIIGVVSVDSQSPSILLYVIDNSLPIIASFDSEEEIDGTEGSLNFKVDSYEEIAIGVPGGIMVKMRNIFYVKLKVSLQHQE